MSGAGERGEALHQAFRDRVTAGDEDDGNHTCRLLRYPRCRISVGQDQVRRQSQQLRCGGSYPIGVAQTPLEIDLNIAADSPTELLKPLPERRGAELPLWIALGIRASARPRAECALVAAPAHEAAT
jgi:hypothetical protein